MSAIVKQKVEIEQGHVTILRPVVLEGKREI